MKEKKIRPKMPVTQRAKQFAPFQAVGGLEEALKRAEEEHRREMESGNLMHVPVDEEAPDLAPDMSATDQ